MYRRGDLGQVARALRLVNALRGFRRGRTLTDLAAEVDVSVRTVRRALADLVDADVKIELTPIDGRAGARLVERGYTMVPITTRERYTLLAVRSMFDVLRATPLHDDVISVLTKLEQRLDPSEQTEESRMRERIAYVPDGGTKAYVDKEDVIDALQTGILSQKLVRYGYKDSRGRTTRGYVAPFAMLLYRQGLYIVGCHRAEPGQGIDPSKWRRSVRVFAVERFSEAEHLRERSFDVPSDFRLADYLHGAFGIHVGDPTDARQVVIEFSKDRAVYARARIWHESQRLEELPDGAIRFTFTCVNLTPVVSWVLGWGPHARVVEPPELRDAVVAELLQACLAYGTP